MVFLDFTDALEHTLLFAVARSCLHKAWRPTDDQKCAAQLLVLWSANSSAATRRFKSVKMVLQMTSARSPIVSTSKILSCATIVYELFCSSADENPDVANFHYTFRYWSKTAQTCLLRFTSSHMSRGAAAQEIAPKEITRPMINLVALLFSLLLTPCRGTHESEKALQNLIAKFLNTKCNKTCFKYGQILWISIKYCWSRDHPKGTVKHRNNPWHSLYDHSVDLILIIVFPFIIVLLLHRSQRAVGCYINNSCPLTLELMNVMVVVASSYLYASLSASSLPHRATAVVTTKMQVSCLGTKRILAMEWIQNGLVQMHKKFYQYSCPKDMVNWWIR